MGEAPCASPFHRWAPVYTRLAHGLQVFIAVNMPRSDVKSSVVDVSVPRHVHPESNYPHKLHISHILGQFVWDILDVRLAC